MYILRSARYTYIMEYGPTNKSGEVNDAGFHNTKYKCHLYLPSPITNIFVVHNGRIIEPACCFIVLFISCMNICIC